MKYLRDTLRPQNRRDMEGSSRQLPGLVRNLLLFRILAEKGRIWKERDRQGPRRADAGECAVNGRKGKPSMIIVDSRSPENADAAEIKGYDGEKIHTLLSI
jgi:hypothetical protein